MFGNMSDNFPLFDIKQNGINGYVYDFSVPLTSIDVNDILDIHNCLMKNHDIK